MTSNVLTRADLGTLPYFISMAGVDDRVSFDWMWKMSFMYGVYWGVLMHPDKRGVKRYPSLGWMIQIDEYYRQMRDGPDSELTSRWDRYTPPLVAHLCGDYATGVLEDSLSGVENILFPYTYVQLNIGHIDRTLTDDEIERISLWSQEIGKTIIVQTNKFPKDDSFHYLLDKSRGKGLTPDTWPCGQIEADNYGGIRYRNYTPIYAGGINPNNVLEVCDAISRVTRNYAIDMESGIRDASDEFDCRLVEQLCTNVYGRRDITYEEGFPSVRYLDEEEVSISETDIDDDFNPDDFPEIE